MDSLYSFEGKLDIVRWAFATYKNKRYMADIKFHADMIFNMLRCWGGGLAERPDFYHYCNLYGLSVWQEFWITGDVDGREFQFQTLAVLWIMICNLKAKSELFFLGLVSLIRE